MIGRCCQAWKRRSEQPRNARGAARTFDRCLLVGVIAAFVAGCAGVPTYQVQIDSHASPDAVGKQTYVLLAGNKGVSDPNPQFDRFGSLLVRALRAHGMMLRYSEDKADVAVILYYFIGDPREQQYTYTVPVLHKHFLADKETYQQSYVDSQGYEVRKATDYRDTWSVDNEQRTGSYTTYLRSIRVVAIDLRTYHATGKVVVLWQTDIVSRGESADLARAFPALIAAAEPYLATDAGNGINVSLTSNDPRVKALEGVRP